MLYLVNSKQNSQSKILKEQSQSIDKAFAESRNQQISDKALAKLSVEFRRDKKSRFAEKVSAPPHPSHLPHLLRETLESFWLTMEWLVVQDTWYYEVTGLDDECLGKVFEQL